MKFRKRPEITTSIHPLELIDNPKEMLQLLLEENAEVYNWIQETVESLIFHLRRDYAHIHDRATLMNLLEALRSDSSPSCGKR